MGPWPWYIAVSLPGSQYYTDDAHVDIVRNTKVLDRDPKVSFSLDSIQKHSKKHLEQSSRKEQL